MLLHDYTAGLCVASDSCANITVLQISWAACCCSIFMQLQRFNAVGGRYSCCHICSVEFAVLGSTGCSQPLYVGFQSLPVAGATHLSLFPPQPTCRYGGWPRFQMLLSCLKGIADKHNVSVEVVALRWLIDQGTFPIAAVRWSASAGPWATYGHTYGLQHASAATADRTAAEGHEAGGVRPAVVAVPGAPAPFCSGIDAALFQVDSFLDAGDVGTLSTLCGSAS